MQAPRKQVPRYRMQPTTEEDRQSRPRPRPRPRVCRRLFADDVEPNDPVDHSVRDNMLNQINEQINRDLDEACKKYNFDFRNEVPLEGNWVWERIGQPEPQPQPVGESEGEPPLQRLTVAAPDIAPTTPPHTTPVSQHTPAV